MSPQPVKGHEGAAANKPEHGPKGRYRRFRAFVEAAPRFADFEHDVGARSGSAVPRIVATTFTTSTGWSFVRLFVCIDDWYATVIRPLLAAA